MIFDIIGITFAGILIVLSFLNLIFIAYYSRYVFHVYHDTIIHFTITIVACTAIIIILTIS